MTGMYKVPEVRFWVARVIRESDDLVVRTALSDHGMRFEERKCYTSTLIV